MRFYCGTDGDGYVTSRGSGPVAPPNGFELTHAQYNEIGAKGLRHGDRGGHRWQVVADVLNELADDRHILEVIMPETNVLSSAQVDYTFNVRRADGTMTSFNGSGHVLLVSDGQRRCYRINFTNGTKSGSKAFAEPGIYDIVSDGTYRIQGVRSFTVLEEL